MQYNKERCNTRCSNCMVGFLRKEYDAQRMRWSGTTYLGLLGPDTATQRRIVHIQHVSSTPMDKIYYVGLRYWNINWWLHIAGARRNLKRRIVTRLCVMHAEVVCFAYYVCVCVPSSCPGSAGHDLTQTVCVCACVCVCVCACAYVWKWIEIRWASRYY